MSEIDNEAVILKLTDETRRFSAEIVAAHVSHNRVAPADLPALISGVYSALQNLGRRVPSEATRPVPAVPIKKSVTSDWIICLENGRRLKMLKRHLRSAYGLSPDEYRERWGLGPDYPMVAPSYAQTRSTLAKTFGLGVRRAASPTAAAAAPARARRSRRGRTV
jgi:predicted transcriptional regulator